VVIKLLKHMHSFMSISMWRKV